MKRVIFGIKIAVLLLLIVLVCDIVMGKLVLLSAGLFAKISVLWLFHSISMAVFFVVLDLFPMRRFVPGGAIPVGRRDIYDWQSDWRGFPCHVWNVGDVSAEQLI